MMKRYLVVSLIIYSLLTNYLFSQNDSSQVEFGLDYLSGKIIGGVDGEIAYNNYRATDKTYHNFGSSLLYGSKNLFSIEYGADYSNKWGWIFNRPIQINFRPQNSIQFYCRPYFYNDVATDSYDKSAEKTTSIDFGAGYLSDGGKINYQRKKSAWWYYSYSKFDGNSSTYFYLNSTMFFLNSGQFYIRLNSNYSNSARNSPINMYYSGI
ncbi:hypothetical protein JW964_24570, partial [candidate division KSB1 bacterium]|nr:hypothetical protein [candidate division KSB1 bacterium]